MKKAIYLPVFRALGLCGSDRSIPFLREVLTKGWVNF